MKKKQRKSRSNHAPRTNSFTSNSTSPGSELASRQFEEDVKNFTIAFLDKNIAPLLKDTNPDQRKAFWDAMVAYNLMSRDAPNMDAHWDVMETELENLCYLQLPEGSDEELEELHSKLVDALESIREEVALSLRMKGQEMMKSLFGMQSEPGSMTVMMGGGFKDKDGKWVEFGDKL